MAIINTVNSNQFIDDLMRDDYAGWTYEDAEALYEYYEMLSEDIGEDIELDRVAIRCEWDRADNIQEVIDNYSHHDINSLEDLEDHTTVIELKGGRLLYIGF